MTMSPRFPALIAAAVAALLVAAPAEAQRAGTRIGRNASARDAPAAMQLVADCLAARRADMVTRVLHTLPGSREEGAILVAQEPDIGVCMESDMLVLDGKSLRFSARAIRTPMAYALLRRMPGGVPSKKPALAAAEPWFLAPFNALPAGSMVSKDHLNLLDFGHCVALAQWAGTRQLLAAAPDSLQEKAAITSLTPVLGGCLVEGMTVSITPRVLRDALAEPVYHLLADTPRQTAAAK